MYIYNNVNTENTLIVAVIPLHFWHVYTYNNYNYTKSQQHKSQ